MGDSWLDILDAEGESIRSRLMKSTEPIADALLAVLSEEEDVYQVWEGADPNEACENGLTPLHRAALNGSADLTKLLVNRGADVNIIDTLLTRLTPLALAEMLGRTEIVDFLKPRCAAY